MKPDIALIPFRADDLSRLETWLLRRHVARWFPRAEEHLEWASAPPAGGDHAVIAVGGKSAGYLRWQEVDRATLDSVGLPEIPAPAVDIDLFLGEVERLGRGIGPAALESLVQRLRRDPALLVAGLTSSVENRAAHSAFERAGFRLARQYSPPGFGPCFLFLRSLRS